MPPIRCGRVTGECQVVVGVFLGSGSECGGLCQSRAAVVPFRSSYGDAC